VNRLRFFRIAFCVLFCFLFITTACSSTGWVPQWSGSGFIREEFLDYKKVVVLPFKGDTGGEASDAFAERLREKFPQVALFEQKRLLGIFEEQDLYPGKLNESTRRRIGKVLGVQALIMGDIYYPTILRWLLQVQIVDVETGEVMGRSFVEINYMGAEGVKEACKIAVQNLTLR
jgi:hypothetical protein